MGTSAESTPIISLFDTNEAIVAAERALIRQLAGRALSVAEARAALQRAGGLTAAEQNEIIDSFLQRRYLDDDALAEQIAGVGWERKHHGRRKITQSLAQRKLPADVVERALSALPDDEWQQALEYARSAARTASGRDRDATLRRLVGRMQRRGFSGGTALAAARAAIDDPDAALP